MISLILFITSIWFLFLELLKSRIGKACKECNHKIYGLRKYLVGASFYRDVLSNILHLVQLGDGLYLSFYEDAQGLTSFTKITVAGIVLLCAWWRVFYYMSLFHDTAFFIRLVKSTLEGMIPFLILTIVVLLMISNIAYVINNFGFEKCLQENEGVEDVACSLLEEFTHNRPIDTVLNTYLVTLGHYDGVISNF